jgi:hypothetical protein
MIQSTAPAIAQLCLLLLLSVAPEKAAAQAAPPAATGRPECPGLAAGACGPQCQLAICDAMAALYQATSGATWRSRTPEWPSRGGGEACAEWLRLPPAAPAARLKAAGMPPGTPRYCASAGVFCCGAGLPGAPAMPCPFQFAPTNLTLFRFNLTVRGDDARMWESLGTLVACGVRRVVLQGNGLDGPLPARLPAAAAGWLKALDISENYLHGTMVGAGGFGPICGGVEAAK